MRYHHSDVLMEAINVGLLFYFKATDSLHFAYPKSIQRLKNLYEDELSENLLISSLKHIQDQCKKFNQERFKIGVQAPLFPTDFKVERDKIVPVDATVLRFGEICTAVQYAAESKIINDYSNIYLKYYDAPRKPPRRDEQYIVKAIFSALSDYNQDYSRYIKKNVSVPAPILPDGKFSFEFSWKNQIDHYVKPVSFDLSESSSINAKAAQYYGYFSAVMESINGKIDVITHRPKELSLFDSYERAKEMLSKVSKNIVIVTENHYEDYAKEVIDHNSSEIAD